MRLEALEGRRLLAIDLQLLKDINPGNSDGSSDVANVVDVSGVSYFSANTDRFGSELWRSDGTAAGTTLVKDIRVGYQSSQIRNITVAGSRLFFFANDGVHGFELWTSDGTEAGTVLVKDRTAGSAGGVQTGEGAMAAAGSVVYFSTAGGTGGSELWRSDGTEAGTYLLKDINPVDSSSPGSFVNLGGTIYFIANDGTVGRELWRTDGTAAGTWRVRDIYPGFGSAFFDSSGAQLTAVGSTLYFRADDGTTGDELWKSDGTDAGTQRVKDIAPGSADSLPKEMTLVNGEVFFSVNVGQRHELWKTNGIEAGTVLVKTISTTGGRQPESLTNVNGTLFFQAMESSTGIELWKSDGTTDGTVLVKDITPGSGNSNPTLLTAANGVLYFSTFSWLWQSDGTEAGTFKVLQAGTSTALATPLALANVGDHLFVSATDAAVGRELWRVEDATGGATLLKNINPPVGAGSFSSNPVTLGGLLYFSAFDGTGGTLWRSDGTEAGTLRVSDIGSGPSFSEPGSLTIFRNALYFSATDSAGGRELWRSDGTAAGTMRVKDIVVGSPGSSPADLKAAGDYLYFTANDGVTGVELWRTDGTEAGTIPLADIRSGSGSPFGTSANLPFFTESNGALYFQADDGMHGYELWRSDGTESGTAMVRDIQLGSLGGLSLQGSPAAPYFTSFDGWLYFVANDGASGSELWKSDGTFTGTTLAADIYPGTSGTSPRSSAPNSLTVANGVLFFTAQDSGHLRELWKLGPGSNAASLVKEINPGGFASPGLLQAIGDKLFFAATNDANGRELWTSDGTTLGTVLVTDIRPGFADSDIRALTKIGERAVFRANDGVHGEEWWASDGTAAGTYLIEDLTGDSGGLGSSVAVAQAGSKVFVVAMTPEYGTEFWVGDLPTDGSDYDANGQLDGIDFLEWQRRLGSTVSPAGNGADGDGSGEVDAGDLAVWDGGFSAASAAVAQTAVSAASQAAVADAVFAGGDFTSLFAPSVAGNSSRTRWRPARRA